jgi:DNA-binding Xre family transcriptional regulator
LPDSKERTVAVSELTEELGLTEAGINVFKGVDSNEQ